MTPAALGCLRRRPAVNLTAGCAHACLYCYSRTFANYPGDGRLVIYPDLEERIDLELRRKRVPPDSVYFSTASDIFQPVPEVQEMAGRIIRVLFRHGVGFSFLSKGAPSPQNLELLLSRPELVSAHFGLLCADETVMRLCEPGAAPPAERLAAMAALSAAGVRVQVRLDPILPGITDSEELLEDFLPRLGRAGVAHAAAATLFLRPAIAAHLRKNLPADAARRLFAAFSPPCHLYMNGTRSRIQVVRPEARRELYARVTAAGRRHGVEVRICACKNNDVASGSCSISDPWRSDPAPAQLGLF